MTIILCIAAFLVAIVFVYIVSFFSGSETALISINKLKLKLMANSGFKNAKILSELMKVNKQLVSGGGNQRIILELLAMKVCNL